MATQLPALIKRRGVAKGKLTRFGNSIRALQSSSRAEIETRKTALEQIRVEFDTVQTEIEMLDGETDHNPEWESFESLHLEYAVYLNERLPGGANNATANSPANSTGSNSRKSIAPKVEVKPFDGDYLQWNAFHDTFVSVVHEDDDIPSAQKFILLKSYLIGKAATVMGTVNATEDNYFNAWEQVKKRYDKPRKIVLSHIRAIFELEPVPADSPTALREFLERAEMHLKALKGLNQPVEWHELVIYILSAKLDKESLNQWQRSFDKAKFPTTEQFFDFFHNYAAEDEHPTLAPNRNQAKGNSSTDKGSVASTAGFADKNIAIKDRSYRRKGREAPTRAYVSQQVERACILCKQAHPLHYCNLFLKNDPRERSEIARKRELCRNCLRRGHSLAQCTSSTCRKCRGKHHTLLHLDNPHAGRATEGLDSVKLEEGSKNRASVTMTAIGTSEVILSTARIQFIDRNNRKHVCKVLLDGGSQSNFMTSRLANLLQLPMEEINLPTSGLGRCISTIKQRVRANLKGRNGKFSCQAEFLVIPQITERMPSRHFNIKDLPIPAGIELADPELHKPAEVDALLGEHLYYKLLSVGQIRLSNDLAVLQKTRIGWVLSGQVGDYLAPSRKTHCYVGNVALEKQLTRFWEIAEYCAKPPLSNEEQTCEDYFRSTTRRDASGRYIVRLPFNGSKERLGDSYRLACRRFHALENKLQNNAELKHEYTNFINEYKDLGHMTDVTDRVDTNDGFYLPHHAVIKKTSLTTKLRVVFDASAKSSSNISLNDTLMVGPTIQDDVFSLIVRFRKHAYVLTADIEKMFRQILVDKEDAKFQRILWRENKHEKLRTYRLDTVTYGTATAPFFATRCLQQLAEDEEKSYPWAAQVLRTDFYMDDLLTGAPTREKAAKLHEQLLGITSKGGFRLRQWASNDTRLLENVAERAPTEHFCLDPSESKKTLGIYWHSGQDTISYQVAAEPERHPITKRKILSSIAQLFDPLGLLGPIIVRGKILMQDLWKCGISWDESVPQELFQRWKEYRDELPLLNKFVVPREISIRNAYKLQLHGFSDASESAYGACMYLRSETRDGQVDVRLICAKARVAPLKIISLPRLELCAALLLARLLKTTEQALQIQVDGTYLWSDSTVTLHWLKTPPHTLQTFVANRVSEVQRLTAGGTWRHVVSGDNPADLISRGQSPKQLLADPFWIRGPKWLARAESTWPKSVLTVIEIPERKVTVALTSRIPQVDILSRYSSFERLQRIIAYCRRFANIALKRGPASGTLTVDELEAAHNTVVKLIQAQEYNEELLQLEKDGCVKPTSKLAPLTPIIDQNGIIRVGGRLRNSTLSNHQKHPILLPKSSHITRLIIRQEHLKNMHAGVQGTLNAVKQRYWPIDGRNITRFIVRNCLRCARAKPRTNEYVMMDLPSKRVTACRPFENVGTDYCGPFYIKEKRFRNTKRLKVYVAIFVCFATKAVHLELVSDLTTEAFVASLKRFFARRGLSKNIYSDNGTNFVGAKNEIDELQGHVSSIEHNDEIREHLARFGIKWHFSPPRSPHFGGLWEAAVKSFKHHMSRTIGENLYTFEQLNTFIIEVEAILNSRPLTPLSTDPNDFLPLTPAHFLIGEPMATLPEHDLSDVPSNRLSIWQHIQQLRQHFWSRWHKEYLHQLNIRSKWYSKGIDTIRVGTLVVLKDENLPPLRWNLGRITEIHPGPDNVIRVVTVKTTSGTYVRSVKGICTLPVETNE